MGGTSCKVPLATEYIDKVVNMGRLGKKASENSYLKKPAIFLMTLSTVASGHDAPLVIAIFM